jgi:DNA-binding transcriptional regulator PaaX
VAGCFEKAKEISMKNFVDAFDNLLTREQIKSLIYRLENDGLIVTVGVGRWTVYKLSDKIDNRQNILKQFQFHIEA